MQNTAIKVVVISFLAFTSCKSRSTSSAPRSLSPGVMTDSQSRSAVDVSRYAVTVFQEGVDPRKVCAVAREALTSTTPLCPLPENERESVHNVASMTSKILQQQNQTAAIPLVLGAVAVCAVSAGAGHVAYAVTQDGRVVRLPRDNQTRRWIGAVTGFAAFIFGSFANIVTGGVAAVCAAGGALGIDEGRQVIRELEDLFEGNSRSVTFIGAGM